MFSCVELTVGVTTALGDNIIVSDEDIPTSFSDAEATKHLKILGAVNESRSRILTYGTGRQIT